MILGLLRRRIETQGRLHSDRLFVGLPLTLAIVTGCALYAYQDHRLYWIRPVFCVVILSMFAFSAPPEREGRLRALLIELGNASYSIYLVHSLISGVLGRIWARFFLHWPPSLFVVAMLVASSIAGMLMYRFVEKPLLNASVRFFSVRSKKPAVSGAY